MNMSCVTGADLGLRHNICGRENTNDRNRKAGNPTGILWDPIGMQATLLEIPWDLSPTGTPLGFPPSSMRVVPSYVAMLAHSKGVTQKLPWVFSSIKLPQGHSLNRKRGC